MVQDELSPCNYMIHSARIFVFQDLQAHIVSLEMKKKKRQEASSPPAPLEKTP
jgi:hypothetical protein